MLDNVEEKQFRAVTWSVLFAMAEESLPASILKLAFIEIPTRLFESLLLMTLNIDAEFRLNSLALFHRLFHNGLSFTGHSIKRESKIFSSNTVLSKTALLLLSKFRSTLFRSLILEGTMTPHICAIDGLLKSASKEADLTHLVLTGIMLVSLQEAFKNRPAERRAVFQLLLISQMKYIAEILNCQEMLEFFSNVPVLFTIIV